MKLTKSHVAEIVRQYAIELRQLAVKVDWRALAYLLEVVALESDSAAKPVRRRRAKKLATAAGSYADHSRAAPCAQVLSSPQRREAAVRSGSIRQASIVAVVDTVG